MAVPMTGDFANVKANAEKAYQDALANISTQRTQLANRYGYNPDGSLGNNPYGQYQQIEHNYTNQQQDLANSKSDFQQQYGVALDGNGGYSATGGGVLGRLGQDHTTTLDRLGQDYSTQSGRLGQDYNTQTGRLSQDYNTQSGRLGQAYNTDTSRLGEDYNTTSGRMGQDHATTLARLADAMKRSQFQAGMQGTFDANGNPTGLHLSNDNQYGAYQTLLGNEANQLSAAEDASRARGLGGKGLGAQGVQSLRQAQGGERQNFTQSLMDLLRGNAQQTQDENTGYGRSTADLLTNFNRSNSDLKTNYDQNTSDLLSNFNRNNEDLSTGYNRSSQDLSTGYNRNTQDENTSYGRNTQDLNQAISQAVRQFGRTGSDLNYQHGLDQYNMSQSLADSLSGLDQQQQGAAADYTNSNISGMLDNIMSLINSGDVPGAGTGAPAERPAAIKPTTTKKPIANAYTSGRKKRG